MSNVETVQEMYAAFGRGDVAAILAHLAEDVEWEYGGGTTDLPWFEKRRGRAAVAGFFEALGAIDIHRFEPKTFLAAGDVVVVLLDIDCTVRANGRPIAEEDEVHIWRFGPDGRVTRFRHRADTHLQWAAFHDR